MSLMAIFAEVTENERIKFLIGSCAVGLYIHVLDYDATESQSMISISLK